MKRWVTRIGSPTPSLWLIYHCLLFACVGRMQIVDVWHTDRTPATQPHPCSPRTPRQSYSSSVFCSPSMRSPQSLLQRSPQTLLHARWDQRQRFSRINSNSYARIERKVFVNKSWRIEWKRTKCVLFLNVFLSRSLFSFSIWFYKLVKSHVLRWSISLLRFTYWIRF